jgi:hypothetical protein
MEIFHDETKKIIMIRVSTVEAADLIVSLASQIGNGNPNTGRLEQYTTDRTYVSISVHKEYDRRL